MLNCKYWEGGGGAMPSQLQYWGGAAAPPCFYSTLHTIEIYAESGGRSPKQQ